MGEQTVDVYGEATRRLVKIGVPLLEYRYGRLEADFPGDGAAKLKLRSPTAKDVSLGMWIGWGYDFNIIVSETDYNTGGGTIDNVPGANVSGNFYGELTNEITFFGKVPLSVSLKISAYDGSITPTFAGGYKIQW